MILLTINDGHIEAALTAVEEAELLASLITKAASVLGSATIHVQRIEDADTRTP